MDFSLDFFLVKFSHFFKVHSFSYTFFLEISSDYKLYEFRSEQPSNPNFEYSPPSSRPHIGVGMDLVVPLESTDAYLFFGLEKASGEDSESMFKGCSESEPTLPIL